MTWRRRVASWLCGVLLCLWPAGTWGQQWIPIRPEARPGTRWWWLGSAVDSAGLEYGLREMARVGIGGVEITPIYGVQGEQQRDIPFLSARWMRMLGLAEQLGRQLGVEVDMATGTGWPFGGPQVPLDEAACKVVPKDGRLLLGRTRQQVKRASTGGEGLVIDHFDADAVRNYLAGFSEAFVRYRVRPPHAFFCDSYEVYGADWTPRLPGEFERRRGYRLQDCLDDFLLEDSVVARVDSIRADRHRRVLSDYRETLGELLLENFTMQWTQWAHGLGALTRCQAHGSPANLLDLYAAVDVPECEGFGLSDFGIRGLRRDPGFTKPNFSDISMLKYASSGAHIAGKPFTSSETFTWLTEHFRTSLSQCKPDLDLMFVAGVNRVYFHGTCYSPKDEPWPGWRFYAAVDMSPQNPQWDAMPAFCNYIARCQSFLQWGEPDNDFLVYLPFYDMIYEQPGRLAMFDIHSMADRAPRFIKAIQTIVRGGFDVDYVSDRYLLTDAYQRYEAVIVPDVRFMPIATLNRLAAIADTGKRVVFVGHWPESVPGQGRLSAEQPLFAEALARLRQKATLAADYAEALSLAGGHVEPMRLSAGLSCIRRSNPDGHHYFVTNLTPDDVDDYISLGVQFQDAEFYNPMTGEVTRPELRGRSLRLQLASGESILLRTYRQAGATTAPHHHYHGEAAQVQVLHDWKLTFPQAAPTPVKNVYKMENPRSWTDLGSDVLCTTMATGCYSTTFTSELPPDAGRCTLELGDVRESARVVLNGQEVATLFAVPFRCDITPFLKKGKNRLDIYVTNLPANRIAQMDRDGVKWRRFRDINVVDLNYGRGTYDAWPPTPSGLCSEVKIVR